jgi:hypothetical protein
MYSKKEVCFTAILTLIVLGHSGSQKIAARACAKGTGFTVADGGHPPPPIPPTPNTVQVLRADGGHPPPPTPWFSSLGS